MKESMEKSIKLYFDTKIKEFGDILNKYLDGDGDPAIRQQAEGMLDEEIVANFKTYPKETKKQILALFYKKKFRKTWVLNEFRYCIIQRCFFSFVHEYLPSQIDRMLTVWTFRPNEDAIKMIQEA